MLRVAAIGIPLAMYHRKPTRRDSGHRVLRSVSSVMLVGADIRDCRAARHIVFAIVLRWLPATGWVSFCKDPIANLCVR